MTRHERENLIERYLRGEMSLEEEENFFIEVASNPELRYELKAYQVVERAISSDRTAGDRPYTALRARMQKQLAASHLIAAQAGTTVSTTPSSRNRRAAAVIAGAMLIVALGFFILTPRQEPSVNTIPSPSVTSLPESVSIVTPPAMSQPAPMEQSATPNVTTAPQLKVETVSPVPETNTSGTAEQTPVTRQRNPARRQPITSEGSTQAASNNNDAAESMDTSTADPNDSISIRFELMTPRSSQ